MASEPAKPEFSVAAAAYEGHMVVTVRGDLDLRSAPEMDTAIGAALRMHPYTLTVDLSAVTFMDSSACRSLVQARQEAFKSAVELELRGITDSCRRTLELLKLDKLFTFTDAGADGDGQRP
jgi:anti-sigma B factor antagonist